MPALQHSRLFPLSTLVRSLTLAAGLAVCAVGCSPKAEESAAPTTVGMEIDDTVVTTMVKSALLENTSTKGSDIKVETRKGVVQLSGFVDDIGQADRAMAVARGVQGVKDVTNATTVKQGSATVGNAVDDTVVTTRVKAALLADPAVKSFDIAVVTRKGEVQLSGFVATQAQIEHAQSVTRGVEGVQTVLNQLAVQK